MTLRGPQDGAKIGPSSPQDGLKSDLKRDRFLRLFFDRFLVVLGFVLGPQMSPFGHPFGDTNRSKNRSKIELLKRSLQDRPKSAQDPPKRPPRPPRRASGPPKRPPGPPPDAPRSPPGPPRTTQNVFRGFWPNNVFRKNRKSRNRRKHVEKKEVDNGHPRWSPASVLTKNQQYFQNGRNPEGGGGGRAKRSSIILE